MKWPQPSAIIYPNKYGFLPSPGNYIVRLSFENKIFDLLKSNVLSGYIWKGYICKLKKFK